MAASADSLPAPQPLSLPPEPRVAAPAHPHPAPVTKPVSWQEATRQGPVRFATDIVPILTKAGCNQGACHGAQAGKGGFKQSLRGWDPAYDWEQIVKDSDGKRIDKAHPEKSLVFLKPTAQLSHGGGQRFAPDSPEAALLLRWLKEGAAAPYD
jgi:hypothetical protein